MTLPISGVSSVANASTFDDLYRAVNNMAVAFSSNTVTADVTAGGSLTTGNTRVNGSVAVLSLSVNSLSGGNNTVSGVLPVTSNVSVGNSTSNVQVKYGLVNVGAVSLNSTVVAVGANVLLSTTALSLGNSTVNAFVNSSTFTLSGAAIVVGSARDSVAVANTLVGTRGRVNFILGQGINIVASDDAAGGQVNVTFSTLGILPAGAGGSNTNILFNDSTAIGGNSSLTFDKTTNSLFVANAVLVGANVVLGQGGLSVGNSTVNSSLGATFLVVGNATVNATAVAVGANVVVNTTVLGIGNSTVFLLVNSTAITPFTVGNSTVNSTHNATAVAVGANVVLGQTGLSVGNSTVNVVVNSVAITSFYVGSPTVNAALGQATLTVANSTQASTVNVSGLFVGANLQANSSSFQVGNSTVSAFVNSSLVQLANSSAAANLTVAGLSGGAIDNGVVIRNVTITSQTLTDAATVGWDANLGVIATVTLGGNRTMAAPTNLRVGTYVLHVLQDGTGSRTLAWNAVFKWPGGVAPTLSTGASKRDVVSLVSDGTNLYGTYMNDVR